MNRFVLSCLIASSLLIVGCDNTGGKKAVSGTVTLKGAPLDQGMITFLLPEGQTPEASISIKDGKFSIPALNGLLPGKYRVRINSQEEFNITPEELTAGKTAPPNRERIPAKFNTMSQEIVEVSNDKPNVYEFKIE